MRVCSSFASVTVNGLVRSAIQTWPDGVYAFEDVLELPDDQEAIIRVSVQITGSDIVFDFEGTDATLHAPLNTVLAVTASACYYVRALPWLREMLPANAGCFAPVHVQAPEDTLVKCVKACSGRGRQCRNFTANYGCGSWSSGTGVCQGVYRPAGQGTMNNVTIGGKHADGSSYAYYETLGGGMGAAPDADGLSGVHVHMSNTLNTPVEALEMQFPFRIREYVLIQGSGGAGQYNGGEGLVREYEFLEPATVTMLSARRRNAPWGLYGGSPGRKGQNTLIDATGKRQNCRACLHGDLRQVTGFVLKPRAGEVILPAKKLAQHIVQDTTITIVFNFNRCIQT